MAEDDNVWDLKLDIEDDLVAWDNYLDEMLEDCIISTEEDRKEFDEKLTDIFITITDVYNDLLYRLTKIESTAEEFNDVKILLNKSIDSIVNKLNKINKKYIIA